MSKLEKVLELADECSRLKSRLEQVEKELADLIGTRRKTQSRKAEELTAYQKEILEKFPPKGKSLTTTEIVKPFGDEKYGSVTATLSVLKAKGLLVNHGRGLWERT